MRASGINDAGVLREHRPLLGKPGDCRAGVVWHTQGSGKCFTMLFFAARVIRESAMQNPTLVVLTDRSDLDDQLFGKASALPRHPRPDALAGGEPRAFGGTAQAGERGVVFATIPKFMPEGGAQMAVLSGRENTAVIADEAHRSQYGFGGE